MAKLLDVKLADKFFPHRQADDPTLPDYRDGQGEALRRVVEAFNSGKKFVMLEAPTGAGKSPIGITVAKYFKSAYYLTIQKILQTQITQDYGSAATIDLKGRNAYPCTYWDNRAEWIATKQPLPPSDVTPTPKPNKPIACDMGVCKVRDQRSKCAICVGPDRPIEDIRCAYWNRVDEAQKAHLAVMNFKSFLYQTTFSNNFGERKLLIIDEAHRAEPELLDFISINIMDTPFSPLRWPKFDTAVEYAKFIRKEEIVEKVAEKQRYAAYAGKVREAEEWSNLLFKLRLFLEADNDAWVAQWRETKHGAARIVELKPIFLKGYAYKYLFDHVDHVLLMSATILSANLMREMLDIKKEECYAYKMKNRFPKKHRPIVIDTVGSMSYKNKHDTMPKLVAKIIELCQRHKDHKGIIHTHNFEIASNVIDAAPRDVKERLLFQRNYPSKEKMLEVHGYSKDSIIIAPAMHEGLDLKDDLSRFQIIAKMPYPQLGDNKQLRARMELSPDYYGWLTALKLVQSCGRSIRSAKDWAITYILDSDFEWFYKKNTKLMPSWFQEAIIWK